MLHSLNQHHPNAQFWNHIGSLGISMRSMIPTITLKKEEKKNSTFDNLINEDGIGKIDEVLELTIDFKLILWSIG